MVHLTHRDKGTPRPVPKVFLVWECPKMSSRLAFENGCVARPQLPSLDFGSKDDFGYH
jgi:hypothetical protein